MPVLPPPFDTRDSSRKHRLRLWLYIEMPEWLQNLPDQILIYSRKIGTPAEIPVGVPFVGNSLIQAAVNGVSNKPERIFGMPPEG